MTSGTPPSLLSKLLHMCSSLPPLSNEAAEGGIKEVWGLQQKADCFQLLWMMKGDWCGHDSSTQVLQRWRWFGKCLLRRPVMMADWQQREGAVKVWQFCKARVGQVAIGSRGWSLDKRNLLENVKGGLLLTSACWLMDDRNGFMTNPLLGFSSLTQPRVVLSPISAYTAEYPRMLAVILMSLETQTEW